MTLLNNGAKRSCRYGMDRVDTKMTVERAKIFSLLKMN